MITFLAEVGQRVADRWFNALVLPGVLWLATLVAGTVLGQPHALAVDRLRSWADRVAAGPGAHSPAVALFLAAALLAAAAGLAAGVLGAGAQRLWALAGVHRPLRWAADARRRRWDRADVRLRRAVARAAFPAAHSLDPAVAAARLRETERRRAAQGARRPERPSWIGDRLALCEGRARSNHGLELADAWPRLWPLLPDALRSDLAAAGAAYGSAARLFGWSALYLPVAVVWWPAAVVAAVVALCAWQRARAAAAALTALLDTAVDLHLRTLARQLGIPDSSPGPGPEVMRVLRAGSLPPPPGVGHVP